ncbi:MAG: hypothetical protein AAB421_05280 [Patescibacteria group bacterium]
MAQKVIRIGSSIGVTIPKDVAQTAGLSVGDLIRINKATHGRVEFTKIDAKGDGDAEVLVWANQFVSKHIEAFKELAK